MARKKNSPSKTDAKSNTSKASAISGVVKGAEFDELDAAMADTKVEGVKLDGPEAEELADVVEETVEDAEVVDDVEAEAEDVVDEIEESEPDTPEVEGLEADVAVEPTPATTVIERRGGFWAPLFGGALAASIGFGGAIYFKAADWPVFGGTDFAGMIAEQSNTIEELQAALVAGQSADAEARDALTARIDELPTQSAAPLPEDVQAKLDAQRAEMELLESNLEKMRNLTQGQIATAQAMQDNAAQAEASAKARGALNALRSALETGAPFASVVPDIAAATDVPDVLTVNAEAGVPTLKVLEEQFADGARVALSASLKATVGDSATDKLTFFLKDQLGARSLTPRDGEDPDAVLSRAEAATKSGDLDTALSLIDALPAAGKAELQDWAGVAATRRDALAAFDSLSDALNAN